MRFKNLLFMKGRRVEERRRREKKAMSRDKDRQVDDTNSHRISLVTAVAGR